DRWRADGRAHFCRMHENRRLRPLATAQATGRTEEPRPLASYEEDSMAFTRRRFVKALGSGVAISALGLPPFARAQNESIRVGLMTVKTGPLASGGIDMERGLTQFLKEHNSTLAGRKVELFVGDSAGVPAQARTKMQELVERDKIQAMIGPLAAAE